MFVRFLDTKVSDNDLYCQQNYYCEYGSTPYYSSDGCKCSSVGAVPIWLLSNPVFLVLIGNVILGLVLSFVGICYLKRKQVIHRIPVQNQVLDGGLIMTWMVVCLACGLIGFLIMFATVNMKLEYRIQNVKKLHQEYPQGNVRGPSISITTAEAPSHGDNNAHGGFTTKKSTFKDDSIIMRV